MSENEGGGSDRFAVIYPHEPARCLFCKSTHQETTVFGCWWNGLAMARGEAPAWVICDSCMEDGVCQYISDDRRESVLSEFSGVESADNKITDT